MKASLGDDIYFHSWVTTGIVDGAGVDLLDGHFELCVVRGYLFGGAMSQVLLEFDTSNSKPIVAWRCRGRGNQTGFGTERRRGKQGKRAN